MTNADAIVRKPIRIIENSMLKRSEIVPVNNAPKT